MGGLFQRIRDDSQSDQIVHSVSTQMMNRVRDILAGQELSDIVVPHLEQAIRDASIQLQNNDTLFSALGDWVNGMVDRGPAGTVDNDTSARELIVGLVSARINNNTDLTSEERTIALNALHDAAYQAPTISSTPRRSQ
jgi:hypothetical protein